jgi:4-hydroxy-tetrahydrodipicolinate synthase
MFKGCITALVTPFKSGKIDYKALEKLISLQIKEGINGIVLCGSTGEAATISKDERKEQP